MIALNNYFILNKNKLRISSLLVKDFKSNASSIAVFSCSTYHCYVIFQLFYKGCYDFFGLLTNYDPSFTFQSFSKEVSNTFLNKNLSFNLAQRIIYALLYVNAPYYILSNGIYVLLYNKNNSYFYTI